MCDRSPKDEPKNKPAKSDPCDKQQNLPRTSAATATSYVSQFVTFIKGLLPKKKTLGDGSEAPIPQDVKELLCKTEESIRKIYDTLLKEVKELRENELQACKNYSNAELEKVETKFKAYSAKIQEIVGELIKRLNVLKNDLQTRIMTHEEIQNFITYFEEKIDQTKKLTDDMIKSVSEILRDPKVGKKIESMVENKYKSLKNAMDTLYEAIKGTNVTMEHKSTKAASTTGHRLKPVVTSYILRIIAQVKGLVAGKKVSGGQSGAAIPQNLKHLLTVTEAKIKEFWDEILKKVKDIHDNELQSCKNGSKEELGKVKSTLREYSVKIMKLSEETLKRLNVFRNNMQNKIVQGDFQNVMSYIESVIIETKKLTEDMIKTIRETINDPTVGKDLKQVVNTNSHKIKIAMDDLYTAIKNNIAKAGQLKSLTLIKMPAFGKLRPSIDGALTHAIPVNDNGGSRDSKGNQATPPKKKLALFNFSKHFNNRTIHGRANVAKATYAGVIIYYIYRKVKNDSS